MTGRVKPGFGAGPVVALIAALLIPILGGGQIILTRQALLADAEHDAQTLSHSLAQHASRTIEEVDLVLAETVEEVEQSDSSTRLLSSMRRRANDLQQLSDIAIVDRTGTWTSQSGTTVRPINSAGRAYFAWHRDHTDLGTHIGDVIVGRASGKPTITLSRRIDTNGEFAGVARAGLDPAYLQAFYDSIDVGPKGTIGLWRETGELLVRHPVLVEGGPQRTAQSNLSALFSSGRSGSLHGTSPIDGIDRIVAFEHLEKHPLVVTAAIAVDDALAGWRREALIEVLVLVVTSTGLMGLAFGLHRHQRHVRESEHRTARHLEKARVAAELAAQLKTDFVANMSHELRTPLTGILGIHDLLEKDPTLGEAQKRYVAIARDAGRALLAIVNDVLDFSKIEAGELAVERVPFDVTMLIDSCHHLAKEQANGKPLAIRAVVEDTACLLLGDPARLRQILLNLITNAIKFTERGTITITAAYWRDTGRLRIDVSDTGIGIPADKIPLLFRRFSQADTSTTRKYGGTGLGLAISKSLVELMGGAIGVDSVIGAGTTFWIEVPLAEVSDAAGRLADERIPKHRGPCRVLLAEDNGVNQEVIAAMLEQWGHAVTIVNDGAAAISAAGGRSEFDVILMDVQMPVMDGLAATRAIRAAEANVGRAPIPIIGLTANAMIGDIQRCRQAGMDAHVAKPIEWADLLSAIDRLVTLKPRAAAMLLS